MDGVQLARAIRQTRDAQALPLVLLTSMGQRQKQVEAAGVEFSAYCTSRSNLRSCSTR